MGFLSSKWWDYSLCTRNVGNIIADIHKLINSIHMHVIWEWHTVVIVTMDLRSRLGSSPNPNSICTWCIGDQSRAATNQARHLIEWIRYVDIKHSLLKHFFNNFKTWEVRSVHSSLLDRMSLISNIISSELNPTWMSPNYMSTMCFNSYVHYPCNSTLLLMPNLEWIIFWSEVWKLSPSVQKRCWSISMRLPEMALTRVVSEHSWHLNQYFQVFNYVTGKPLRNVSLSLFSGLNIDDEVRVW